MPRSVFELQPETIEKALADKSGHTVSKSCFFALNSVLYTELTNLPVWILHCPDRILPGFGRDGTEALQNRTKGQKVHLAIVKEM
jgi:hypothetical protein